MSDKLTKSAKRTILVFEEFVRKEEVVNFIKELRRELNLPENGLDFNGEDERALSEPINAFFYTPKRVVEISKSSNKNRAIQACNVFAREYGHSSIFMGTLLRFYVLFNRTMDFIMGIEIMSTYNEYLRIEHLPSELSARSEKFFYDHFSAVSKNYPVVILVNPEVSQREIQEFISHNWSYIQAYKGNKKVNVQRKKKKSIQERNDFVYQNKHLPRKQIMAMITDKFGADNIIDYGYIGKIISLEKRRRENK